MIAALSAEWIKLKRTPVWFLIAAIVIFCVFIMTIGCYIDIHPLVELNLNPWKRFRNIGHILYTNFFICPFAILLTSAFFFVEQRANAWKYLYTLPVGRTKVLLSKLITLTSLLFLTALLLATLATLAGYSLGYRYPEMEFYYHSPKFVDYTSKMFHSSIAILGVIGIQTFLCFRFRNVFIPLGIGIGLFILGLVIGTTNQAEALYFPYSYPLLVFDFEMFNQSEINIQRDGFLSNVEWWSLGYFFFFSGMALWLELRKNVK